MSRSSRRPLLLSAQRHIARLRKMWIDWRGTSGQVYFEHRVGEYRAMWRAVAEEVGATFTELTEDVWELHVGNRMTRIHNHELELDDPVTLHVAGDKPLVHRLLQEDGIAVPEHVEFDLGTLERANEFVARYPAGCVVKPADGYGGRGTTTHVQSRRELRKAAVLASLYSSRLLVERQVPGECYRLLVFRGEMVHAVCRRGPRVRGDGRASVRQLMAREGERRAAAGLPPLDVDRDCLFTLGYQALTLDSVPEDGRIVLLRSVDDPRRRQVEVRTVYNEVVTHLICDSVRADAERAAAIVGSEFAGVDIITTDPGLPLKQSGGVVNEVNTTPALHHHYDRAREAFPAVAKKLVPYLLRTASP